MSDVKIEGDEIVIRVPVSAIDSASAIAFDRAFGFERHNLKVNDRDAFAKEVVRALRREVNESGDTLVDHMLDKACVHVAESGGEGLIL